MNEEIVQDGHKALRNISKDVPIDEIGSKKIQDIIRKMHKILASALDGVALAAPQIGLNLRIFVVSSRIYSGEQKNVNANKNPHLVYINPIIKKVSSKKEEMTEGCLSVRNIFGKIHRHKKITLEAYDESGMKFHDARSGLLSEIFQHEIDHLDGILFIDTAKKLVKLEPQDEGGD